MQRAQLRTATQTRRSARAGFPEPDDFEGLPVRQWRQEWVNVAPTLQQEMTQQSDRWAVELPYGMPRESHLLPPHTQELLRAARSGRLYKRPAPAEEEEPDAEVDAAKGEKKEWEPPSEGYMVKMWKQVPRNAESQTVSHLAKRHKNTVTLASKAAAPQMAGPTVIRATVRRIDAAGNPYEQTVTLSEGQHVDGEIISTTVVPAPSAPQGELPVQQATPVRRRPPPPKRKPKGIGRGRKKGKLPLPLPATRSHATAADGASIKQEGVGADGIKIEDTEDSGNQDSEMADVSGMPSEDEEGDAVEGEEGEEGDEEGVEDEDADETPNAEGTHSLDVPGLETEDSEMSEPVQPTSIEEPDEPRPAAEEEPEEVTIPKVRFQPPPLGAVGPAPLAHVKIEGSPLKNVMILSPTEPSRLVSPQGPGASIAASSHLDVQSQAASLHADLAEAVGQADAAETTVQEAVPEPVDETAAEQPASFGMESPGQPTGETLPPPADADVEMAETTITGAADQLAEEAVAEPQPTITPPTITDDTPAHPSASIPAAEPTTDLPSATTIKREQQQPSPPFAIKLEHSASATPLPPAPPSPSLAPATMGGEDEDEGLNLLGSLERELDRQEGVSSASDGEGKGTPDVHAAMATEAQELAGPSLTSDGEALAAGGNGGEDVGGGGGGSEEVTGGDDASAAADQPVQDAADVDTIASTGVGDTTDVDAGAGVVVGEE